MSDAEFVVGWAGARNFADFQRRVGGMGIEDAQEMLEYLRSAGVVLQDLKGQPAFFPRLGPLDAERAASLTVAAMAGDLRALLKLSKLLGRHHGWKPQARDYFVGKFVRENLK